VVESFLTRSADETRDLGEKLAAQLKKGFLVCLIGDLGAGKTTFVQGVGRGLGIDEALSSPTFVLVNEYCGRDLILFHADLYRLENSESIEQLALSEYLQEGALIIEWGERWLSEWGTPDLTIQFDVVDETTRRITMRRGEKS
jgi:tRNA threonylcarbamoyladenosine biosynthesis protein TsaE